MALGLTDLTSASSKKIENLLRAVNLCFAHHTNGQVDKTTTPEVEMVYEWFVEFYPADADRPEQPIYFDGFSATLSHIQSIRSRIPTGPGPFSSNFLVTNGHRMSKLKLCV